MRATGKLQPRSLVAARVFSFGAGGLADTQPLRLPSMPNDTVPRVAGCAAQHRRHDSASQCPVSCTAWGPTLLPRLPAKLLPRPPVPDMSPLSMLCARLPKAELAPPLNTPSENLQNIIELKGLAGTPAAHTLTWVRGGAGPGGACSPYGAWCHAGLAGRAVTYVCRTFSAALPAGVVHDKQTNCIASRAGVATTRLRSFASQSLMSHPRTRLRAAGGALGHLPVGAAGRGRQRGAAAVAAAPSGAAPRGAGGS
jgi:hypothetical protein